MPGGPGIAPGSGPGLQGLCVSKAGGEPPGPVTLALFTVARLLASVLLIWTVWPHEAWFYLVLRILVCLVGVYGTRFSLRVQAAAGAPGLFWPLAFALTAVAFVPLWPARHDSLAWQLADVGVAALLVASVYFLRVEREREGSWLREPGEEDAAALGEAARPLTVEERVIFLSGAGLFGLMLTVAAAHSAGSFLAGWAGYALAAAAVPAALWVSLRRAVALGPGDPAKVVARLATTLGFVIGPVAAVAYFACQLVRSILK